MPNMHKINVYKTQMRTKLTSLSNAVKYHVVYTLTAYKMELKYDTHLGFSVALLYAIAMPSLRHWLQNYETLFEVDNRC